MKKMNSKMVTISWIVTVIFAIILVITWVNAAKIQTPYGSPASSLPYILGMLIRNGLIPGIFWLITYFTAQKVNGTNNQNNIKGDYKVANNNSVTHIHLDSHNNSSNYIVEIVYTVIIALIITLTFIFN